MEYNGPRTRHYNEVSGDSFTVSGRPHYLERRGITMKQNFTVTQIRTDSDALVPDYFYEGDDEKHVNPPIGEPLPFTNKLEFDNLCLADSFTRCNYRPENCTNSTEQNIVLLPVGIK